MPQINTIQGCQVTFPTIVCHSEVKHIFLWPVLKIMHVYTRDRLSLRDFSSSNLCRNLAAPPHIRACVLAPFTATHRCRAPLANQSMKILHLPTQQFLMWWTSFQALKSLTIFAKLGGSRKIKSKWFTARPSQIQHVGEFWNWGEWPLFRTSMTKVDT